MRAAGLHPAALCESKSCFMCYRWMMIWEQKWLLREKHQSHFLCIPHIWENNGFRNGQASHSNANIQKYKRQKIDDSKKKEHGHDCTCTLAGLNQNHMWLHMSSYAAVMAWPFNSVTNLLFLWKPQTINHGVQSGGLSWKFSTSSLSNDCSAGFTGSEGEVTNFTQLQHSHGETNKTRFTSGLWWNDRRRGESFCQ